MLAVLKNGRVSITPLITFAVCLPAALSCSRDLPDDGMSDQNIRLVYASVASDPQTRNVIDDGTLKITWTAGDAINVFFGASSGSRFVTEDAGAVAKFKGSVDVITGGGEGLDDDTSLWGIYPYDAGNSCDGKSVTITIPSVQNAAENTFAKGLFPQIARSRNFYMSFYNLCGCFRFSVSNSDICSVTLSGNGGEALAGKAKVSMDGVPGVEEILFGETELTMNAPDGGCFKPGVNYYFVLYPTTFSKGLKLTYYKKDSSASYEFSNSYTLKRGVISRFKDRDAGLTFVPKSLDGWGGGETVGGDI